jgi:hypothetical protein
MPTVSPSGGGGSASNGLPSQWSKTSHGQVTGSVDDASDVLILAPPDSSGNRDAVLLLRTDEVVGTGACVFEIAQSAGKGGNSLFEQYDTGEVDITVVDDAPAIKIRDNATAASGTNLLQVSGGTGRVADVLSLTDQSGLQLRAGSKGVRYAGLVAAPADGDVPVSGFAFWLDPTPGATLLKIKAKDSGGTVRTASVPLT